MSTSRITDHELHETRRWRALGALVLLAGLLLANPLYSRDPDASVAFGGGGISPVNPPQLPSDSLLPTTPTVVDARRDSLLLVTVVSSRRSLLLLRSQDAGRVVTVPVEAGVVTFEVTLPDGEPWLMSLLDSDVIDLPVVAGQDIAILTD